MTTFHVLDPGHGYVLYDQPLNNEIRGGAQELHFLKRSGRIIKHDSENAGLLSQTVLRVLIDRTKYLNELLPCDETSNALYHLRMALFMYEARAYRRKQEKVNRQDLEHDDTARAKPWHDHVYPDVPFGPDGIELLPIGEDGHILILEDL